MDYERIHKPSSNYHQSGGFSPSKLRAILLGIEKQQKEEELESGFSLRSDEDDEIEDRGANATENCRDVDMVSSPPECSTSMDFVGGYRSRDHNLVSSRVRAQENDSFDSDSVSSSVFEFHKTTERVPHRSPLMPPFSKIAPSKWDDAQKWIGSPISNWSSKGGGGLQSKKSSLGGYGNRSFGSKVVLEVADEVDTKRIDPSQAKKGIGEQKAVNLVPESLPAVVNDKPSSLFENPFADSAISLSKHHSSDSVQSALTFIPPPTVKSVSMIDMGTEMTPIASQEASRTGTPIRPATPTRSPNSSRPLSPARIGPTSSATELSEHLGDSDKKELSEKELKMKTRREIMVLGQQLGKMSIAAWASKEAEESDGAVPVDQPAKNVNNARAAAWEDAGKAKYLARFKQEEIKIQAWENHQKAKTEAEMRKIEDLRTRYTPAPSYSIEIKFEQEPKPERQLIADFFTECRETIDGIRKILEGMTINVDTDSELPVLIETEVVEETSKSVEDPKPEVKEQGPELLLCWCHWKKRFVTAHRS